MTWDLYFISMLYLVAMKSKDKKTQHGAIIVGSDNEIRSTGYNSFPRGIDDNKPERQERPEKYYWVEHSERNAIYNAARVGVPLKGCKIYVTDLPCMDCARAIVQAGITEVIYHVLKAYERPIIWDEHHQRSLTLFEEAGVVVREYKGDLFKQVSVLRDGELVKVF